MGMMPDALDIATFYSRKPYQQIVDDILVQITKGITKDKLIFRSAQLEYSLAFSPITRIEKVEGVAGGRRSTFEKNTDFIVNEEQGVLVWNGTGRPDEGTEFQVTYAFKKPHGLTDANPGSVIRTIVEAVTKELDEVYERMDNVYNSAFLDTATGESLDHVAALVGIRRKPPTRSMGYVTFWRDSDPPTNVIDGETILFDGREKYTLKEGPIKIITAVRGVVKGIEYQFSAGKDYDVDSERSSIMWLIGGAKPDTNTPFSVNYIVYERILVPRGTIVSTFSKQLSEARLFETLKDDILGKSETGKWEANLQVRALEPGQHGNVIAGSITLMPKKPPTGVEHVINRSNMAGGSDHETDEDLRRRARSALELAGRATIGSLRAALESIEGIQSPPLIKENPDSIPGLIKVVLDGGDEREIIKVIEDTRAAGIRVEFFRPKVVSLDINLAVVVRAANMPTARIESLKSSISTRIVDFVSSLRISEDLIYNQILSSILGIEEIRDVKDMTIDVFRDGTKSGSSLKTNIEASEDERLYPRIVNVSIEESFAK